MPCVGRRPPGASAQGLPSHLPEVSLCAQEADLGLEVDKDVVLVAEPGVGTEAVAQTLLAMASSRRDSVAVEAAVRTDNLMPIVDQQQVLAR